MQIILQNTHCFKAGTFHSIFQAVQCNIFLIVFFFKITFILWKPEEEKDRNLKLRVTFATAPQRQAN